MATRKLEVHRQEGISTNEGVVHIEGGAEAKVFEVSKDARMLIMVLKSDDICDQDLHTAQARLRSQLQRYGMDGMLFAISTNDDFEIYEET